MIHEGDLFGNRAPAAPPPSNAGAQSCLGSLVYRPMIYRRKGVAWLSVRSWRTDTKRADLAALKAIKAQPASSVVVDAADDIVRTLELLFGKIDRTVVNIPCGHSRRSDCFGKSLAQQVAT